MSTRNLPILRPNYRIRRRLRFIITGREITGSALSYVLTQSAGVEVCTLATADVAHVRRQLARLRTRARRAAA